MDLAVLALSCGATHVASLMWSHPVSPTHVLETGVSTGNHDASHYGETSSQNARDFVTLKRWFMDRFVYLIEKLAATPDDGGSLLDNTLVVLCSELGENEPHTKLLVSVAQALDVDIDRFGCTGHGTGPLPGLSG